MSHSVRALGLCGLVLIAAAAPAAATSFVMVSDQALADQASAIVEGSVVSVEPSPAGTAPSTDYLFEIDRLIHRMYEGTIFFGRQGAVIQAMSGVEIALWDIVGKATGRPVYQLLGGGFRKRFRAYASILVPWNAGWISRRCRRCSSPSLVSSPSPSSIRVCSSPRPLRPSRPSGPNSSRTSSGVPTR